MLRAEYDPAPSPERTQRAPGEGWGEGFIAYGLSLFCMAWSARSEGHDSSLWTPFGYAGFMRTIPLAGCLMTLLFTGCASTHHDVIQRERAWTEAMRAKDTEALREIMAPDFRLTFEEIPPFMMTIDNGEPVPGTPRWRWLENLEAMSFGPVEISRIDTVQIADDLVAVNMWMYLEDWRWTSGETIPPLYDLTDIWLNRDGQWRVITRYSRPLDESEHRRPTPDFTFAD